MNTQLPKIALVVSHPIQHFCPQYASFAKSDKWKFKVFFMSALGHKAYEDKDFGRQISWDNLRLNEFDHVFIKDEAVKVSKKQPAGNLLNELEKYDPNVVISYGYAQLFQRQVKNWANKHAKLIYYISDSELNHKEMGVKRWLKSLFLKRYFRNIDRFLTVGTANEIYYSKNGVPQAKLSRMNFPIDVEHYEKIFHRREIGRQNIRSKYSFAKEDFVCCVVGKLVPWKSQLQLIEALKSIDQQQHTKINLMIIGTGEDEVELRRVAKEVSYHKVVFTGFVQPEELAMYYAASDLYVHPAAYEPHSLAISEAIYMGLPLLISDTCGSYGPNDDLVDGKNGYVYKFTDISALARMLQKFAGDRETGKKFGEHSRKYAVSAQKLSHKTGLELALHSDGLIN